MDKSIADLENRAVGTSQASQVIAWTTSFGKGCQPHSLAYLPCNKLQLCKDGSALAKCELTSDLPEVSEKPHQPYLSFPKHEFGKSTSEPKFTRLTS